MQVSIPVMEQETGFIPSKGCLRVHGSSPNHMYFVDVEKAFDYVPHGILWEVLQVYGLGDPVLAPGLLRSLCHHSRCLVHTAGSTLAICHLFFSLFLWTEFIVL